MGPPYLRLRRHIAHGRETGKGKEGKREAPNVNEALMLAHSLPVCPPRRRPGRKGQNPVHFTGSIWNVSHSFVRARGAVKPTTRRTVFVPRATPHRSQPRRRRSRQGLDVDGCMGLPACMGMVYTRVPISLPSFRPLGLPASHRASSFRFLISLSFDKLCSSLFFPYSGFGEHVRLHSAYRD